MIRRLIFTFVAVVAALGTKAQIYMSSEVQKFALVSYAIQSYYVDTINEKKMIEEAIKDMLHNLDPHSMYIPAEEVQKMNEPLDGSFDGIGVQFQMMEDTLLVIQTISGGPSEKVGIRAGDRIVAVNDTSIAGKNVSTTDIQKKLRGKKGTSVEVKVLRRGVKDLISFKIVRDKIPIYSIDAAYMVTPEIGYIKLNRFSATTVDEYNEAYLKLKKQGVKSLILDLQDNGGGYLSAAERLANEYLPSGQLIVYT
ncbi:MAG: S41 family peptidase, partial [Paludibacteraceae bacterium]|nr:S41 family peptidase [Paludibacteraceae bacterium]